MSNHVEPPSVIPASVTALVASSLASSPMASVFSRELPGDVVDSGEASLSPAFGTSSRVRSKGGIFVFPSLPALQTRTLEPSETGNHLQVPRRDRRLSLDVLMPSSINQGLSDSTEVLCPPDNDGTSEEEYICIKVKPREEFRDRKRRHSAVSCCADSSQVSLGHPASSPVLLSAPHRHHHIPIPPVPLPVTSLGSPSRRESRELPAGKESLGNLVGRATTGSALPLSVLSGALTLTLPSPLPLPPLGDAGRRKSSDTTTEEDGGPSPSYLHFQARRSLAASGSSRERRSVFGSQSVYREELKITTTLFIIIVVFVLCWAPVSVVNVIETFTASFQIPLALDRLTVFMVFAQCAANPVIYGLMNRNFREGFKKIFCCICSR